MRSNLLTTTFFQIANQWTTQKQNWTSKRAEAANSRRRRLMCVLAHPDDEALCLGGTIAKYAAEGVEVALVVATRGERGWRGDAAEDPGLKRMGQVREQELRAAAFVLGVREVQFLGYVDGEVGEAPREELNAQLVRALRRFRPDVVITFDAHGMYGHPDHIAISQATTTALMLAADAGYAPARTMTPHRVQKLYYRVYTERALEAYQAVFGELRMEIEGITRGATGWREWAITTRVETGERAEQVRHAIGCHRSQVARSEELRERFLEFYAAEGGESFYRAMSVVGSGRGVEGDLFEEICVMANL